MPAIWSLTDEAKNVRRRLINDYNAKINAIKSAKAAKEAAERAEKERIAKEEAQKRFVAYWEEHANEKVALEREKEDLTTQIAGLNDEISKIPGATEISNLQERINKLSAEKSSLGLFKLKEKKALQEQIDAVNVEIKKVQDRMATAKNEIQKKIDPLQSRISTIDTKGGLHRDIPLDRPIQEKILLHLIAFGKDNGKKSADYLICDNHKHSVKKKKASLQNWRSNHSGKFIDPNRRDYVKPDCKPRVKRPSWHGFRHLYFQENRRRLLSEGKMTERQVENELSERLGHHRNEVKKFYSELLRDS